MLMEKNKFTIREVADYIISKYPECCLAYNSKNNDYTNDELVSECVDFFYFEKLHWCGCGDPDSAQKAIRDYLNIIYKYRTTSDFKAAWSTKIEDMKNVFGYGDIYDNTFFLCFAYALDAAELTEHGTSIGGAWPTNEGVMFLTVLNQKEFE